MASNLAAIRLDKTRDYQSDNEHAREKFSLLQSLFRLLRLYHWLELVEEDGTARAKAG